MFPNLLLHDFIVVYARREQPSKQAKVKQMWKNCSRKEKMAKSGEVEKLGATVQTVEHSGLSTGEHSEAVESQVESTSTAGKPKSESESGLTNSKTKDSKSSSNSPTRISTQIEQCFEYSADHL